MYSLPLRTGMTTETRGSGDEGWAVAFMGLLQAGKRGGDDIGAMAMERCASRRNVAAQGLTVRQGALGELAQGAFGEAQCVLIVIVHAHQLIEAAMLDIVGDGDPRRA